MESSAATDADQKDTAIPLANIIYVAGVNLRCTDCDQLFHFQIDFANHMAIQHDVERPYICHHCEQSFDSKRSLIQHINFVHYDKGFKCEQCGSSYTSKSNVKAHIRRVHDHEVRFTCEFEHCGKGFFNKSNYTVHCRRHTGEKPFECPLCSRKFVTAKDLKKHDVSHSKHRPFICEVDDCRKEFKRKKSLKEHKLRMHTNNRSFKCGKADCGKKFNTKLSLNDHVKCVHPSHIALIRCNECGKLFKIRHSLTQHHRLVHQNEINYKCGICNASFFHRANFETHCRVHTGERFSCKFCDQSFACKWSLKRHNGIHEDLEEKTLSDREQCRASINDNEKRSKYIKIRQTVRLRVVCNYCNRTYRSKQKLREHIKRRHGKQNSNRNNSEKCAICNSNMVDRQCKTCIKTWKSRWQIQTEHRYMCKADGCDRVPTRHT